MWQDNSGMHPITKEVLFAVTVNICIWKNSSRFEDFATYSTFVARVFSLTVVAHFGVIHFCYHSVLWLTEERVFWTGASIHTGWDDICRTWWLLQHCVHSTTTNCCRLPYLMPSLTVHTYVFSTDFTQKKVCLLNFFGYLKKKVKFMWKLFLDFAISFWTSHHAIDINFFYSH